ncbi:MAG: nitrate- and nitrite sensing domain-containing protein, partial [Candidatus Nitrospinota bacterium M3_3B_026]
MKSLQAKLIGMLTVMLFVSLILAAILVRDAWNLSSRAEVYDIKNEIAGHLNAAAGWQAIERGVGATILGSDSPPAALISKFKSLGGKGDNEAAQAMEHAGELEALVEDDDFRRQLEAWKRSYEGLRAARSRVLGASIKRGAWISAATANIEDEFSLRDIAFAPTDDIERVRYYNSVTRANVATLAEYAGRERAVLGGFIASGNPISPEALSTLKNYRAIVENVSRQVRSIKNLAGTPPELEEAIGGYERNFLGTYQQLREKVYEASEKGAPYPVDGAEWIERATDGINSALAISNTIGELSTKAAENVDNRAWNSTVINVGLFALAIAAFAVIIVFVRRAVIKPLHVIIENLDGGSVQVSDASGQIATSSQSLAEGATEQASSLEETSSALEQMASMTKQNADNASEADSLARKTR